MDGSPEFSRLDAWDQLVMSDPAAALARARTALPDEVVTATDVEVLALHAASKASFELGQLTDALQYGVQALEAAQHVSRDDLRWEITLSVAAVHAQAGRLDEGLAILDDLQHGVDPLSLGRIRLQQAFLLHSAGRLVDALARVEEGDRLLLTHGEPRDHLRMALMRGLLFLDQGRLEEAARDFGDAVELAARAGASLYEGIGHCNLGVTFGRSRRLALALQEFDRADECFARAGSASRTRAVMFIDRVELLLNFGLVEDALVAAYNACDAAAESRNDVVIGDALLLLARVESRAGRHRRAGQRAEEARRHFSRTGRADMIPQAEALGAQARLREASAAQPEFQVSRLLIERLRQLGWSSQADALALEGLRTAWRLGAWDAVAGDLADLRLHAFDERRDLALLGWFAEAVARYLDGDAAGSVEACSKGLDFLDDITAEATDLEARSAAMRLGHDLSRWIIEVAVDQRDADLVLAASEGTRARALHEELDGRERHRPLTPEGADRLLTELRGRLHGRCLVQWVVAADRVHAVVCDEHGNRLVDVADLRSVVRERDRLMVWLDRAAAEPDGSSERAMRAARLLDELLLVPLGLPDGDSVVIVPVDELHGVPWSGLPSIAGRPVVLGPSCRLWLDADRRSSSPVRSVGFVAGPNLTADDLERATLRGAYGRVDEATGAGATAATVRTMFGGHDLVHIAAHGRFRADRPLLSTFELADGEVTLHESVPSRVGTRLAVLSSCEGGAHRGTGGSEVLGLSSVLLARGAASVLAPLTVVRDLECGEFVSAVHDEMATGTRFGLAVANVRARWLADGDLSRWAVASSFACFGSGATRRTPGV